jgi:hypothetical protein
MPHHHQQQPDQGRGASAFIREVLWSAVGLPGHAGRDRWRVVQACVSTLAVRDAKRARRASFASTRGTIGLLHHPASDGKCAPASLPTHRHLLPNQPAVPNFGGARCDGSNPLPIIALGPCDRGGLALALIVASAGFGRSLRRTAWRGASMGLPRRQWTPRWERVCWFCIEGWVKRW